MADTTINTEIFERLQEQLRRQRQQFDEWANKQATAIQRSTEEHTKTVVKEKGTHMQLSHLRWCL